MENQSWNDYKFEIHWSKLEWVNPRSCIGGRKFFCVYSKKFCLEDNSKTAHQVGHLKLKPVDLEDFYKIKKKRRGYLNRIREEDFETSRNNECRRWKYCQNKIKLETNI